MDKDQEFFNALGLNINLADEKTNQNIDFLSSQQIESAGKLGYTFPVLVPGQIARSELILKVIKFMQKSFLGSINFYTQDYHYTKAVIKPNRAKKIYQILLKPEREVNEAHPETNNKDYIETIKILASINIQNPGINALGMTLEEYLMAQVYLFFFSRAWFESSTTTWLLEEQLDTVENPDSCLRAYFRVTSIGISACPFNTKRPKRGARFAIVPVSKVAEDEWRPHNQLME